MPQVNSHLNSANQQSNWPRGKVLGGCSSINNMQYVRCDPHDYDNWNLSDWSFEQMLPYFKKLECADEKFIPKNEKYRNHDPNQGVMNVTMFEDANELHRLFIQACESSGFRESKDYNAQESLNGIVSMSQVSTKDGKRWSTASGYLLPLIQRKNADILVHAHVCRVKFDQQKQVTGKNRNV